MPQKIGTYELVRYLATGGMAEIWVARKPGAAGFEREVAIKRILPHMARDERFTSMFLDEATIAARLNHPNVVQIYELGEVDGEYFIAMEYIKGPDLAHLLDISDETGELLPIDISVRIVADVLAALDFAHEYTEDDRPLNIVHRDVSPHNVLVSREGVVKLVDFGVAKAVERHHRTETGLVKGKLAYMPPEQIEEGNVDRRADVFSAGVLLYELLTGATPFGRELTAVTAILHEDARDPRETREEIPEELVDIVFRALEKDAADRYQTAHDMLDALETFLRKRDRFIAPKDLADAVRQLEGLPPGEEISRPPPDEGIAPVPFATDESDASLPPAERSKEERAPAEAPRLQVFSVIMLLLATAGVGFVFHEEIRSLLPNPDSSAEETSLAPTPTLSAPTTAAPGTAEGFDFSVEDAVSEMELSAAEIPVFARLRWEREPDEFLFEVREQRIRDALDMPVPVVRFDPGDPEVVEVLDFTGNVSWAIHMADRELTPAVIRALGASGYEAERLKEERRRELRRRLRRRRARQAAAKRAAAEEQSSVVSSETVAPGEKKPPPEKTEKAAPPEIDIIDKAVPDF